MKQKAKPNGPMSPADFVRLWQRSSSVVDVVAATGTSRQRAHQRASFYRKLGVPLKRMPGTNTATLDLEMLKRIALGKTR